MKSLTGSLFLASYEDAAADTTAQLQVIECASDLARLADGWHALESSEGSPTQHFIWAQAYHQTYGQEAQVQVLTIGPANAPEALAPLVRRPGVLPRLELLGVHELCEPLDLLFDGQDALDALAEGLINLGQPLWLERLPADSPVITALERAYHRRGLVHRSAAESYPRIPLDRSWREPESHFNAGRRSDFRRAQRKAAEQGGLSFEVLAPTPAELAPLLAEAYRVEAACWKGAEQSALACDVKRGEFFRHYTVAAAERGILRLCFMRLDGQAVAMQLAVECGQRFWLLKIGYDEAYARCSPGTLLMLHTLRYAAERGLAAYEFLGASQPWTHTWTDVHQQCVSLRAYPQKAGALATLVCDGARHAGIQLQKKLGKQA
ncbi:MAG: GNAT family N-acetyltransferase [Acidobacteria bacterium]|nr:GNAT family N-acetyltransferase [Acidobacteriota bacterium]MBI3423101.1 GNAT family N-acetyltransferase [Acidobacteriota bacterium]